MYIPTIKYYSALKKIPSHVTAQMNIENVMLKEISLYKKKIVHDSVHTRYLKLSTSQKQKVE